MKFITYAEKLLFSLVQLLIFKKTSFRFRPPASQKTGDVLIQLLTPGWVFSPVPAITCTHTTLTTTLAIPNEWTRVPTVSFTRTIKLKQNSSSELISNSMGRENKNPKKMLKNKLNDHLMKRFSSNLTQHV